MNSMHRFLVLLSVAAFTAFIQSCGSGESDSDNQIADTVTINDTAAAQPVTQTFTPFKIFMVKHQVAEFNQWRKEYVAHDSLRSVFGLTRFMIGRGLDDSNTVVVLNKFSDVRKAKKFSLLPQLNDAMKKAGVTSDPVFSYAEVLRDDDSKTEISDRLLVSHHVRNFAAWLKAFDSEGKDRRAAYGLIDRGLARGIDDPNMVFAVFAISDTVKARARMASEDLRKLMTDAGVDSKPGIFFYRIVP